MDLIANGRIKLAAEKKRRIMAASAPFRRAHAGDVLHILDALSVPLIIEGREVVRGAIPLLVNIGVAPFAGCRLHKEFGGNFSAIHGLGRTRKKRTGWTVTFTVHGGGRDGRIGNSISALPACLAEPPRPCRQNCRARKYSDETQQREAKARERGNGLTLARR